MDLIKEVGVGGTFLKGMNALRHTLKYYRSEHSQTIIGDRSSKFEWEEGGCKDLRERAEETIRELLRNHRPEPLDKKITIKIDNIIKEAERKIKQ